MYDLIIIGSGAAGWSAALYAGRYRMKTLVVEGEFGGYTAQAGGIENYPGFMKIDGYDLMTNMRDQAKHVGAEIISGWTTKIEHDYSAQSSQEARSADAANGSCFTITIDDAGAVHTYHSKTVLFAGGAKHRELGLPNEKELMQKGVHYCMTCDGPLYTGKTVAVVGSGDSAVKGVNLSAEYVRKVYMITIDNKITAEPINYERVRALGDKVEMIFETQVTALVGDARLEKIILSKPYNGSDALTVDGLFVEIGSVPNSDLARMIGARLDDSGFIATDAMMRTNVDGFYAAGDTVNLFGRFKQDITAAAMGAVAATSAYEYVKAHPHVCQISLSTV